MNAVLIERAHELGFREVPEAPMGDYHARTRLVAGSICNSTDAKLLHGTFPGCTAFPAALGHEAVGEVTAVGVKVRNYRVGDLVIRPRVCFPPEFNIREYFGSFADFAYVTDQWAMDDDNPPTGARAFGHPQQVLPAGTDPMLGVLSITLKETLSWIRRFAVGKGHRVLVFGTGPVGTAFVLFSRMAGAKQVILAGRTESSIRRAAELCHPDTSVNVTDPHFVARVHEITNGEGVDRAIEGVGDTSVIDLAVPCLSPEGQIGLYGVAPSTQAKALHANHPRVRAISPDESEVHEEFFSLVREGRIDALAFLSHRLPIRDIGRGFSLLANREAFKVGLDW